MQLDPLVCALPDGGDAPDVADVPPVMCGPDGGPSMANDPLDDGMDQNCDGVDGELSQTVFVAESGVDSPGRGRDPSMPVRSLPFAIGLASGLTRPVILMQSGLYDSVRNDMGLQGESVRITASMTVIGRYVTGQWLRRDKTTPSAATEVRGPVAGIIVRASNVTLWGLNVVGRLAASVDGKSTYGVLAIDVQNLTLRELVVSPDPGAPGTDGLTGRAGSPGDRGGTAVGAGGAAGGRSCSGTTNGGGEGGYADDGSGSPSTAGANGEAAAPRTPARGGDAGVEASPRGDDGSPGVDGVAGANGDNGLLGFYTANGFAPDVGRNGQRGEPGTGGGGGGAGYSMMIVTGGGGGGGGGGGCGGEGSTGGQGGGGSFGVYVYGSSPATPSTVNVIDCTITASDGGRGGAGGGSGPDAGVPSGSMGGPGGAGAPSRGGSDAGVAEPRGGAGGAGGRGGAGGLGGPGLGGPSIGLVRVASATAAIMGNTRITAGLAGANGAGPLVTPLQQIASPQHMVIVASSPDGGVAADASPMIDASAD